MTRALNTLCEAEDIGPETEKPKEQAYVKATAPVIPQPAASNPSKLAAAIAAAKEANEAKAAKLAEERAKRDQALLDSEPPRDELEMQADALLEGASKSPEAKEVAKVLAAALAERQEMLRNVRQVMGVIAPEIKNYGENVEEKLRALVSGNGAMREAIRLICEAAGTVRIVKPVPVKTPSGNIKITLRHVDVGDEEPDQEPIVDLEFLIPAAIRAAARFRRLVSEHDTAVKHAADMSYQNGQLQMRMVTVDSENRTLRARNAELEKIAANTRPNAPGTPTGYYLRTENNLWVGKYEGKKACFFNRWYMVAGLSDAHAFEFKEDAQEVLARLQFTRIHRIGRSHRETLRVVTVRFEDQTD